MHWPLLFFEILTVRIGNIFLMARGLVIRGDRIPNETPLILPDLKQFTNDG
jgi:hypothetical protein